MADPAPATTLSSLLLPDGSMPEELARGAVEQAGEGGVGGALSKLTPMGLDLLGDRIAEVAAGLLDLDLGVVIGSALASDDTVAEAMRSTRQEPGSEAVVPLADHTLRSEYSPSVDVVVDGVTLTTIRLDVTLRTLLEGALLLVREGAVREARAGRCTVSGTLVCGDVTVAERSTTLELPGILKVPLAEPDGQAAGTAPGLDPPA